MPPSRRLLAAALALLTLAPAAASRAQAQAQAPGVLRVVSPWEITSLDPGRAGYVFTRMGVAETLLGADAGGLPLPRLATAWKQDGAEWRFILREGATFHDGTPVTAAIVAASLIRARTLPGPFAAAPIEAIDASDARTVTIRTVRPFAALPALLAHSATLVLAPSSFDEAGQVRRVVGSGPFRVTSMDAPLRFEAARFDGWTGGPPPAFERVSYGAVGRSEARVLMAESGQADLVFVLDPASQDRLRRNARVELRVVPSPRTQLLKLNVGGPFFNDVRVRRAVSLLIDRSGIARAILRNAEAPATQMFPASLAEWHVPALPPLHRDVAEARRLLAEAGWAPGADGILAREGRAFRVNLRTFADRPELPLVAAALQDQLREAGIAVNVEVVNSGEIPAGHNDGSLDMALFVRNFTLVPDPVGILTIDYGPRGGEWGAMGWSDPALVDALARLSATSDPAERAQLRGRVATVLHDAVPLVPIAWYDQSAAVSRRLAGVTIDPLDLSYHLPDVRPAK